MLEVQSIQDRLLILNYSDSVDQGSRGWDSIREDLKAEGFLQPALNIEDGSAGDPPTLVIIDWFLPMMQRYLTTLGKIAAGEELRGEGVKMIDYIKTEKNKYNLSIFITHQLNPTAQQASSSRMPKFTDAAEWSSFAQLMERCYGIGVRNEDQIAHFVSSKSRTSATGNILVKMDGAYCKFKDATNDYMLSNGAFVRQTEDDEYIADDGLKPPINTLSVSKPNDNMSKLNAILG